MLIKSKWKNVVVHEGFARYSFIESLANPEPGVDPEYVDIRIKITAGDIRKSHAAALTDDTDSLFTLFCELSSLPPNVAERVDALDFSLISQVVEAITTAITEKAITYMINASGKKNTPEEKKKKKKKKKGKRKEG